MNSKAIPTPLKEERPVSWSILCPEKPANPTPAEIFRLQVILGLSMRAREIAASQPVRRVPLSRASHIGLTQSM